MTDHQSARIADANIAPDIPITFDDYGRMNYHPDYHFNHKKPWKTSEQKYLIECYQTLGPEQVSLALGRTIHVVMTKAYLLRKQGLMPKPKKRSHHARGISPANYQ